MQWLRLGGDLLLPFFTALGVVLGGSISGALGSLVTLGSPLTTMVNLAEGLKMWAIVIAIGGTFNTIRMLESGLFTGQMGLLARQFGVLVMAFCGAQLGYWILQTLLGGQRGV